MAIDPSATSRTGFHPRPWLTVLALLCALGWVPAVMSGAGAAGSDGGGIWSEPDPAAAGDARLVRSGTRITPLPPTQPRGKGGDVEDPGDPGFFAAPVLAADRPAARDHPLPFDPAVAAPRPLHDRPQSLRGPPRLA